MYSKDTNLVTKAFIAGYQVLYNTLRENPKLRQVPINQLGAIREALNGLGCNYRTRYRGPHRPQHDTLKRNARAFTIYFKE